jgi:putative hemolysin
MKTTTQEMAERIEAEEIIEWVDGFNNLKAAMEQAHRELVEAGGMYYYIDSPETHVALADAQATYIQARNLFEQALES